MRTHCLLATLALLVMVAGRADDKPQTSEVDLQKWADRLEWKPPREDLRSCLLYEASEYQVESVRKKGERGVLTVRVSDGEKELYSFKAHAGTVFFERDGVMFHTQYSPVSSGCSIVAFDLKAKKELWKTRLQALPLKPHSAYHNEVKVEPHDAGLLVVYGYESYGKYVEIVDRNTGKTVGHKVFKEEEGKPEK
jgi:hypothetical protein